MVRKQKMDELTFWDLLTDRAKGIEIPVIQRSYAQGRKTPFTDSIREGLLYAIQNALSNKRVMDFVYGTINDSNKFEPLDGQQRLTTLFLLHWYFASKERREEVKETLGKFSYKTRISSERFCKELAQFFWSTKEDEELKQGKSSLSKIIENQSWFASAWKHDPTVLAMLTMLDDIHNKFKDTGNLDNLIKDRAIVFNFINLKEFSLTDDLYIKMNARGKPLTQFELFKSALDKKMQEYKKAKIMSEKEIKEYSESLDGIWLQLFFKMDNDNFDAYFLAFFVRVLEYAILERDAGMYEELFEKRAAILPKLPKKGETKKNETKNFASKFPFEFYDKYIDEKTMINTLRAAKIFLNNLAKIIDNLIDKNYKPINELFHEYNVCKTVLTDPGHKYIESLKFYAYFKYLSREEIPNIEKFEKWMRVVCNVAEAARLDDNYVKEITRFKELYERADSIEEYLKNETTFKGAEERVWQEEQLKARILCSTNDEEWRELIYRAERKKGYLEGTIGFLLRFAGIATKASIEPNALDAGKKAKLKEYIIKTEALFGENGILKRDETKNLFRRALLSYGDYTMKKSLDKKYDLYSLLVLNNYNGYLFSDFLTSDDFDEDILRKLFEGCTELSQNSLESIIESRLPQINDWRAGFVKHPEILDRCQKYLFRRRHWSGGMIVLEKEQRKANNWGYYPLWLHYAYYYIKKNAPEKDIDIITLKGKRRIEECVVTFKKGTENLKVYITGDDPRSEPQKWKWIIIDGKSEPIEIPQEEGGMINEGLFQEISKFVKQ